MSPIPRRTLLEVPLLLGAVAASETAVAGPILGAVAEQGARLREHRLAVLAALVDTLLPGDREFPPASAIGIPDAMAEAAGRTDGGRRLLTEGLALVERAAAARGAASFPELSPTTREDVVRELEAAPERTLGRVFFERVHRNAFARYYAHPRVWSALGYNGPPQPRGFMSHASPPDRA